MVNFKILHRDGKARVGVLKTPHGDIETPNFIPVGTQGTVKALSPNVLDQLGVQVVLSNTYHLMLRPGVKVIERLGGLHRFMSWDKPIMTDSGGFQVFSLGVALEHGVGKLLHEASEERKRPSLVRVTENGVTFQSHLDGSKQSLDAEKSIELQRSIGADLIVSFDDLESPIYSYDETLKSLDRTERWELRSVSQYQKIFKDKSAKPLLYGVTHGGVFKDLRIRSARFVDQHFDGIALGGAHKDRKTLYQVIDWTLDNVSFEKPRHLLGIGEVENLFEGVERGVDLFDCAAPTRRARNGSLYSLEAYKTDDFTIKIGQAKYVADKNPIDKSCNCYTCQNFSRAYLRHLYLAKEILYSELASIHNVYFIESLMRQIREAIKDGRFGKLKKESGVSKK